MSEVEILISENKGVRQLHFGSEWVQGAMRISRPWSLELEYTRDLLAPLLLLEPSNWPKRVLFIGLGVGALPKFFFKYLPDTQVEVVEIAPAVLSVCQMHFKLPPLQPRFQVHFGCGHDYLETTTDCYDLIVVDGFDEDARVGSLDSLEFYQLVRERLNSTGVLATNILAHELDPMLSIEKIALAFESRAAGLSPCQSGNVIGLGLMPDVSWPDSNALEQSASALNGVASLNCAPLLSKLRQLQPL